MIMGCYGIGVSRIAAAAIEQSNDEKGILWPKAIAPFSISIISIGFSKNETINKYSKKLYKILKEKNIDVLLDDRDVSPGIMFSDSDLIGIPYKIIIGKQFIENKSIEFKDRKLDKTTTIEENSVDNPSDNVIKEIIAFIGYPE